MKIMDDQIAGKEKILQILKLNKELIKSTFDIEDSGIDNIREFLRKERKDFKDVLNKIYISDMGNREKVVIYYLIGYVNGMRSKNKD